MSNDYTGWRELWLGSGNDTPSRVFSFTMLKGDSFVTFRRADGSSALHVSTTAKSLVFSEKLVDNKWVKLSDELDLPPGDAFHVIIEATGSGIRITGPWIPEPLEIEADMTLTERVYAFGTVTAFSCQEAESELIAEAKSMILRSADQLPSADLASKRQDDLIFDIGMHNGDDTAYYLAKGFRVVSVDANPQLAEQGAARFASAIVSGKLHIVNLGIAEEEAELEFFVSHVNTEQSSFDEDLARRLGGVRVVKVNTIHPAKLWSAFGVPYYAKIDIEGFDRVVVEAVRDLPEPPVFVSFETGPSGWKERVQVLAREGYVRFKIVDQGIIDRVELPEPSLEGQYVDHKFKIGNSGPFGAETPGEWVEIDGIEAAFEACRKENPSNSGWYDLHASLKEL